jgi:hypothetical protein
MSRSLKTLKTQKRVRREVGFSFFEKTSSPSGGRGWGLENRKVKKKCRTSPFLQMLPVRLKKDDVRGLKKERNSHLCAFEVSFFFQSPCVFFSFLLEKKNWSNVNER